MDAFHIKTHVIPGQHIREYHRATASGKEEPLQLVVNQYIPKSNVNPSEGDVTIIAAHGSALNKELYEPYWANLLEISKQQKFKIRSIWMADVAWQGESGTINEAMLGNDPSWYDHCRDLLSMTNHFRAEMPRPIVGIGHSMGATQLTLLSQIHPRLFTTLVLYEPILHQNVKEGLGESFIRMSLFRQDTWASLAAAKTYAKKAFRDWDPRVVERWVATALKPAGIKKVVIGNKTEDAQQAMTLLTSKHQENISYLRPNFTAVKDVGTLTEAENSSRQNAQDRIFQPDVFGPAAVTTPFYRPEPIMAWHILPHLRPSVMFIHGAASPVSSARIRKFRLTKTGTGAGGSGGKTEGRVGEVCLTGLGHLAPLQNPQECARVAGPWLSEQVGRWEEEEIVVQKALEGKSTKERREMEPEFVLRIMEGMKKKSKPVEEKVVERAML